MPRSAFGRLPNHLKHLLGTSKGEVDEWDRCLRLCLFFAHEPVIRQEIPEEEFHEVFSDGAGRTEQVIVEAIPAVPCAS